MTLADLAALGADEIDLLALKPAGLVRAAGQGVKVIKSGELTLARSSLKGIGAHGGRKAAIEAAGGSRRPDAAQLRGRNHEWQLNANQLAKSGKFGDLSAG